METLFNLWHLYEPLTVIGQARAAASPSLPLCVRGDKYIMKWIIRMRFLFCCRDGYKSHSRRGFSIEINLDNKAFLKGLWMEIVPHTFLFFLFFFCPPKISQNCPIKCEEWYPFVRRKCTCFPLLFMGLDGLNFWEMCATGALILKTWSLWFFFK